MESLLLALAALLLGLGLGLWVRGVWARRTRRVVVAPPVGSRTVRVVLLGADGLTEHSRRTLHTATVPEVMTKPHGRLQSDVYRFSHEANGQVFYRQVV